MQFIDILLETFFGISTFDDGVDFVISLWQHWQFACVYAVYADACHFVILRVDSISIILHLHYCICVRRLRAFICFTYSIIIIIFAPNRTRNCTPFYLQSIRD